MFLEKKHNIETSHNSSSISIYQGKPSHKPYFIAIDLKGQPIIGPNKKVVITHIVGNLILLDWNLWRYECWKRDIVTTTILYIQHSLELRTMTKQSAVPKLSQSAPHIVGIISLLFSYDSITHRLMYYGQYSHVQWYI